MNTQRKLIAAMSLCSAVTVPGLSFGALIDRGGGLIYDSDLNITWLADASHGAGSFYDTASDGRNDGRMTWQNAINWATNLSYYDSVRNVTYEDWRLPTTLQPDPSCGSQYNAGGSFGLQGYGYNCTGSEMGHLFYSELGGVAGQDIWTTHNATYSLFTNLQSDFYWSATATMPYLNDPWHFNTSNGRQGTSDLTGYLSAWAVRPGDVYAASTVPVPAAAWLFGSGLIGLIGVARKKAASQ